ncbi:uncharacterized protein LOC133744209 [Rosa rugosa]|uniref:uncharacterized protein LOC133744209 n=1 Tax=Rosa rugosa TaxID=74645 RepID=UPI002B400FBE|nr:uncharacterized protein LOC133744209 [Rosa rugosa]
MAGDFNEIMSQADKSGDPRRAALPMEILRRTMAACGFVDMGFVGSRFTWSNKYTKERLDRSFQTLQWRSLFPFSRVITLNPSESDHCPILIKTSFRKEWALPTTGNVLRQIGFKFKAIGKKLMQWHKTDFDRQKAEMRIIQEKLNDIMRQPFSPEQYEEQRTLHAKYSQLLSQQEKYWRQRSRAVWLKDGDRNSAFFHRRACNRKSRNSIRGLTDEQGQWQSEPAEIQRLLLTYFKTVFSSEGGDARALQTVLDATPTKVTRSMNESLVQPYTDDEIKAALFQMHPSKSPGPDGMSPFFFQKYWNVVSMDVCNAIRNFLEKGELWPEANYTFLCLIPKTKSPKVAAHFRPIALCNVICRIASKVVANRLKCILPEIISPLQSAYVPGRLISDNTLVATEAAHFMHQLRSRETGQQVNYQKSSMAFSGNVDMDTQNKFASILAVKRVDEHDRYLGLPLRVGRSKTAIFEYIKEKLTKKLINWKAMILSCAGKEILIKAVAQTMPLYAMNCYLLPRGLCDDIHKLCASFFWGDTNEKKKIHWRSWDKLCLTKKEGGMGFKNLYAYNLAMLAKQGWRCEIAEKILCIPLGQRQCSDKLIWSPEKKGFYSVKSAYWIAREQVLQNVLTSTSNGDPFKELWQQLWKAKIPGKVIICNWRACNNLLPTRERLLAKGYTGTTECLLCQNHIEDNYHLFCQCPLAKQILSAPPFNLQHTLLPNMSFKEWMLERAQQLKPETLEKLIMVVWALWKNRNNVLWEGKVQTAHDLVLSCFTWLADFQKSRSRNPPTNRSVRAKWKPPTSGFKLNVDAAFLPNQTNSGIGGVLRDSTGQFRAAFFQPVMFAASPKQCELLAIRAGFDLLSSCGIHNVSVESDFMEAVSEANCRNYDMLANGGIVDDINEVWSRLQGVTISHTLRTCNAVAHRLAALGFENPIGAVGFDQAPSYISDVLQHDYAKLV